MRALLARCAAPVVFRLPGHAARKLQAFARAEQGSMLDLRLAAAETASPKRSALYLQHALDESRHAQMFAARSADLRRAAGSSSYGRPEADTEQLFEALGDRQFETYRDHFGARGDNKTRAIFEAILEDEQEHERYTRELLVQIAGGEAEARRELRRAMGWEAWRTWRRAGRFLTEMVYALLILTGGLGDVAPFVYAIF